MVGHRQRQPQMVAATMLTTVYALGERSLRFAPAVSGPMTGM